MEAVSFCCKYNINRVCRSFWTSLSTECRETTESFIKLLVKQQNYPVKKGSAECISNSEAAELEEGVQHHQGHRSSILTYGREHKETIQRYLRSICSWQQILNNDMMGATETREGCVYVHLEKQVSVTLGNKRCILRGANEQGQVCRG